MIVIIFDEKNNWVAKDESDYDCSSAVQYDDQDGPRGG